MGAGLSWIFDMLETLLVWVYDAIKSPGCLLCSMGGKHYQVQQDLYDSKARYREIRQVWIRFGGNESITEGG